MKIIIKRKETDRKFYNELLYISSKYPNIVKNPNMKVHNVTNFFLTYILIGLLLMILFLLCFIKYGNWIFIVVIFLMISYFFMSLYFFYDSQKFINKELKATEDSSLTLNTSGARLTRGKELDFKIDFKDLIYVVINRYTIVFLPKDKTKLMIGIPSKYKKDIIDELKNLKQDKLIIDNSKKYENNNK